MNQCWLNNNRSTKELLNRGRKPRVSHDEHMLQHKQDCQSSSSKPISKSATSGCGSKCDCTAPCYTMARAHRALPHCNDELVKQHFSQLLKPSIEIKQALDEVLGFARGFERPVSISSGNGIDTIECPNCNAIIDLEVIRAQEALKL